MNPCTAKALCGLLWTVAILEVPFAAIAATTSATLSGYVRSADGEPIAAARIDIVHQPSGTAAAAAAAENGASNQSGLRIGGPYEVRISASGYRDRMLEAVTLTSLDVEEVVVTASPLISERDLNNGVGSAYSADDIANQPSVTRDVIRTLLRDPLAQSGGEGNLSVAGVNPLDVQHLPGADGLLARHGERRLADVGARRTSCCRRGRESGGHRRHRARIRRTLGLEGVAAHRAGSRSRRGQPQPGQGLHTLTAQALTTWTGDGFLWTNYAQTRLAAAQPTGVAPDGRTIYADLDDLRILNLVALGNHGEGTSRILTTALGKRYENGVDFQVSYAWQDVEAVTEGLSSHGISNWRNIQDADRNRPSPRGCTTEVW